MTYSPRLKPGGVRQQPYWGKFEGRQYVRDQQFKLYRDGRYYNVPKDLGEESNLTPEALGPSAASTRNELSLVLDKAPSPPPKQGGPQAEDRPTSPEWPNIVDPNSVDPND